VTAFSLPILLPAHVIAEAAPGLGGGMGGIVDGTRAGGSVTLGGGFYAVR